jgi:hypothetical protein
MSAAAAVFRGARYGPMSRRISAGPTLVVQQPLDPVQPVEDLDLLDRLRGDMLDA